MPYIAQFELLNYICLYLYVTHFKLMNTYFTERLKTAHPFYKIMELNMLDLNTELLGWSREELIEWLSWNDPNGIYNDKDSMQEFENILDKNEAINIIIQTITES